MVERGNGSGVTDGIRSGGESFFVVGRGEEVALATAVARAEAGHGGQRPGEGHCDFALDAFVRLGGQEGDVSRVREHVVDVPAGPCDGPSVASNAAGEAAHRRADVRVRSGGEVQVAECANGDAGGTRQFEEEHVRAGSVGYVLKRGWAFKPAVAEFGGNHRRRICSLRTG